MKTLPQNVIDLSGQRYGRLRPIAFLGKVKNRIGTWWKCACDCGNTCLAESSRMRSGNTRSCGCNKGSKGIPKKHGATIGKKPSPEYICWAQMKSRCLNPKGRGYANYGGRGIAVCSRWRDSFTDFLSDIGPMPGTGYSIERLDNNKGYFPKNCKWATRNEQSNNKRNNVVIWEFKGKRKTVAQWAELLNINYRTLYYRVYASRWSIEKALTTKVKK